MFCLISLAADLGLKTSLIKSLLLAVVAYTISRSVIESLTSSNIPALSMIADAPEEEL